MDRTEDTGHATELDVAPARRWRRRMPALAPAVRDAAAGCFGALMVLLAHFAAGYGLFFSATIGSAAYIGFRMMIATAGSPITGGLTQTEIAKILESARARIETIRRNNLAIPDRDITAALNRIYERAHEFVDMIEADSRHLRTARRFLNFHLDSVVKITGHYVNLGKRKETEPFRPRLMALLDEVEHHLTRTASDLAEQDRFKLDIAMDVLKADLEREGIR